jgi:hypothetical protein
LNDALFSGEKLYTRLLCMFTPEDPFIVVPVPRLPAEIAGGNVEEQLRFLREHIDCKSYDEVLNDKKARDLLGELGPDLNILAYAFNFKENGQLNTDLENVNKFNQAMYDRLSPKPGKDIYGYDLILSKTDFTVADYGDEFMNKYKERLGVVDTGQGAVTVLRSVVMDPWIDDPSRSLTETPRGPFLDVIENVLRETAKDVLKQMAIPI